MVTKIDASLTLCGYIVQCTEQWETCEERLTSQLPSHTYMHRRPNILCTYKIHYSYVQFLNWHGPNGVSSLLVWDITSPVEYIAVGLRVCISAVNLACCWKLWQIILRTIALYLGCQLAVFWDAPFVAVCVFMWQMRHADHANSYMVINQYNQTLLFNLRRPLTDKVAPQGIM